MRVGVGQVDSFPNSISVITLMHFCLLIFTVADGREGRLLPVLVFVHGEDFGYGAGNPYDPSMLVSHGNIVAVTLNYRLGILGRSDYNNGFSVKIHT